MEGQQIISLSLLSMLIGAITASIVTAILHRRNRKALRIESAKSINGAGEWLTKKLQHELKEELLLFVDFAAQSPVIPEEEKAQFLETSKLLVNEYLPHRMKCLNIEVGIKPNPDNPDF